MKAFWIKLFSIVILTVMIITYQVTAINYESMRTEAAETKASLEKRIAEAEDPGIRYTDGTFEGKGIGYSGELSVKVEVSGGKITAITITDTSDDKAYLEMAKKVMDPVIDLQSTAGVDTVSGATFSSRGILDAVDDALKGAINE